MTVRPVGPRGSLSGRPGKVERALRAAPVSSMPTAPADAGALVRRQRLALTLAREFYAGRRRRARYLSVDLFGEPTWDILLDLYVAAREGRRVPTTSACIGAHVPPTTALRWLLAPGATDGRGYYVAGLLLAEEEARTDPVHVAIIGRRDDPAAKAMFAAALRLPEASPTRPRWTRSWPPTASTGLR